MNLVRSGRKLILFMICIFQFYILTKGQKFEVVSKIIDNYPLINNLFFALGNSSNGLIYTHQKGNTTFDEKMEIMSASKLMSTVVVMKLVENGQISLQDYVHFYLNFWTNDTSDLRSQVTIENLLSFQSGFDGQNSDPECIGLEMELIECAKIAYFNGKFIHTPGQVFQYGSIHLLFAGAIVETVTGKPFRDVFDEVIVRPLGLKNTEFNPALGNNPALAFGVLSTTRDYFKFLDYYFNQKIISRYYQNLMELDYTPKRTGFILKGYHYSLGNWFECKLTEWDDECLNQNVHGSIGAYGFYPLFDRSLNYFFVIGTNVGIGGTSKSSLLRNQLKPVLDKLLG